MSARECKSRRLRIPPCSELRGRVEQSASHAGDRGSPLFVHVSAAEMLEWAFKGPESSVAESHIYTTGEKGRKRQTKRRTHAKVSVQGASLQPRSCKQKLRFKASLASGSSLDPSREETWEAPYNADSWPGRCHQKSPGLQAQE